MVRGSERPNDWHAARSWEMGGTRLRVGWMGRRALGQGAPGLDAESTGAIDTIEVQIESPGFIQESRIYPREFRLPAPRGPGPDAENQGLPHIGPETEINREHRTLL